MKVRLTAFILICMLFVGCATSYGPNGVTGGYKEEKINDHTYVVAFSGNGHTSGDTVWYYWIYRCAELTRQNGFSAFSLGKVDGQATGGLDQYSPMHNASFNESGGRFIQMKGSTGGYYYVPGTTVTVTRYNAKAVVFMFNQPYPVAGVRFLLDPVKIMQSLKPYVESGGKSQVPSKDDVLKSALIPMAAT